jgi:hypothetical protein
LRNLKEREYFEETKGIKILFEKLVDRAWTALFWVRLRTSGRLL